VSMGHLRRAGEDAMPSMALGLSTSILGPGALPQGLAALAATGGRWIEIHGYAREEFDYGDAALIEATKQALDRYGLRLWSCHSPAYEPLDLTSSNPAIRRQSRAAMEQAMRASADLGARVFVCDTARAHPEDSQAQADDRRGIYAGILRELLRAASDLDLRFVIENQPRGSARFVTPEDFLRLEETHGLAGLGACWDTGHGWIAGLPPETACRLGHRLVTVHVHDNDGRRDLHWLPTTGQIVWGSFAGCLHLIGYSGPFMMELGAPRIRTAVGIRQAVDNAVAVYGQLVHPEPS
jgi:sugar phosphate isomerase/epimerase